MIIIICNNCNYEEKIMISNHLNNKGCKKCKGEIILDNTISNDKVFDGKVVCNYYIFMKRAKEVHGDKFNYSKVIKNEVNGIYSKIKIICNNCGHEQEIIIRNHLSNKGCKKCKNTKTRYDYHKLINVSREIYGDIFDYSLINHDSIINIQSKLELICKICDFVQTVTIKTHILGKGCKKCREPRTSRIWYCEMFVIEAKLLHENKYNYSKIEINEPNKRINILEKLPIICNTCNFEWETNISCHIHNKTGCPNCVIVSRRWNFDKLIKAVIEIHGDKYDYSKITKDQTNCSSDKIPVICNFCDNEWNPTIADHVNGRSGCPRCSGHERYTLRLILEKCHKIHGAKFNYDLIKEEDIVDKNSRITVLCNTCNHKWRPSITNHIYSKTGCPKCIILQHWKYEDMIKQAVKIHGDKYYYGLIKPEDIKSKFSKLNLICNICKYEWVTTISSHINGNSGCGSCSKKITVNFESFILRTNQIHGDKFDLSLIKETDIENNRSKLPIKCNKCSKIWSPTISSFINRKTGCPRCKSSKGELKCLKYLQVNKIIFEEQFSLPGNYKRKYDFMIEHDGDKFLLEFDGLQHFEFIEYFNKTLVNFNYRQEIDIQKTKDGICDGYKIIRIDYKEIDNIQYHLDIALEQKNKTYFSNHDLYYYIISKL